MNSQNKSEITDGVGRGEQQTQNINYQQSATFAQGSQIQDFNHQQYQANLVQQQQQLLYNAQLKGTNLTTRIGNQIQIKQSETENVQNVQNPNLQSTNQQNNFQGRQEQMMTNTINPMFLNTPNPPQNFQLNSTFSPIQARKKMKIPPKGPIQSSNLRPTYSNISSGPGEEYSTQSKSKKKKRTATGRSEEVGLDNEDSIPPGDEYDVISARDIAIARYQRYHDYMASILSPLNTKTIIPQKKLYTSLNIERLKMLTKRCEEEFANIKESHSSQKEQNEKEKNDFELLMEKLRSEECTDLDTLKQEYPSILSFSTLGSESQFKKVPLETTDDQNSQSTQLYQLKTVDRLGGSDAALRKRASFLYTSKRAADLSNDDIYEVGIDGLSQLILIDRKFERYSQTLLSLEYKQKDRILLTKEQNKELDLELNNLIIHLSAHFLTRPAGKVLEWLIRRFRINEFNVKELISAMIPYHSTKEFSTLLGTINIPFEEYGILKILIPYRKIRQPMEREALVKEMHSTHSFGSFLNSFIFNIAESGHCYDVLGTFYCVLNTEYIETLKHVGDTELAFIVPIIITGLKSRDERIQVASYHILCALSSRVFFTENVFENLFLGVISHATNIKLAMLCLIKFIKSQNINIAFISTKIITAMANTNEIIKSFDEIPKEYGLEPVIEQFLMKAAKMVVEKDQNGIKFISSISKLKNVSDSFTNDFFEILLWGYIQYWLEFKADNDNEIEREIMASYKDILAVLFAQYLVAMEKVISTTIEKTNKFLSRSKTPESLNSDLAFKKLYELTCMNIETDNKSGARIGTYSLKLAPIASVGTGLYIALNSANPNIRIVAVKELSRLITNHKVSNNTDYETDITYDSAEISSLIYERLKDENPNVISEVLSLDILKYMSPNEYVEIVLNLVNGNMITSNAAADRAFGNLCTKSVFNDMDCAAKSIVAVLEYILKPSTPINRSVRALLMLSKIVKESPNYTFLNSMCSFVEQYKGKDLVYQSLFLNTVLSVSKNALKKRNINLDNNSDIVFEKLLELMRKSDNKQIRYVYYIASLMDICLEDKAELNISANKKTMEMVDFCFSSIKNSKDMDKKVEIIAIFNSAVTGKKNQIGHWENIIGSITLNSTKSPSVLEISCAVFCISLLLKLLKKPTDFVNNGWFSLNYGQSEKPTTHYEYYSSVLKTIFLESVSHADGIMVIDGLIIGELYETHLKDEWIQFLASLAADPNVSNLGRTWSLLIMATFIQSSIPEKKENAHTKDVEYTDYQMLLPILFVCLADKNTSIRTAAISCLKALEKSYGQMTKRESKKSDINSSSSKKSKVKLLVDPVIYKSTEFYGSASGQLQCLPTEVAIGVVNVLASCSEEIEASDTFMENFLAMTTGNIHGLHKPIRKLSSNGFGNALVTVFLSHLLCLSNVSCSYKSASSLKVAILKITAPAINFSHTQIIEDMIISNADTLFQSGNIPSPNSFEDIYIKLLVSCISENSLGTDSDMEVDSTGLWNTLLGLIVVPESSDLNIQSLENTSYTQWSNESKAHAYLQDLALSHIHEKISKILDEKKQSELLSMLLGVSVKGVASSFLPNNSVSITTVLNGLNLDPGTLIFQLNSWITDLGNLNSETGIKSMKSSRGGNHQDQGLVNEISLFVENTSTLVMLLEIIASQPKETKCSPSLTPPLFELLECVRQIDSNFTSNLANQPKKQQVDQQLRVPVEYLKQLLVTLLLNIFNEANQHGIAIDEGVVRVDIMVNVLRQSSSLQTQTQSLLLLAAVAVHHSETVLHHVMSIFTFMGDSVLRQDDNYTLHVIHQAIEKIIPSLFSSTLIASNLEASMMSGSASVDIQKSRLKTASSILRVFVDSLPYIPHHRRLPLFKHLLDTIGCEEFNSVMFVLLLEKYSLRQSRVGSGKPEKPYIETNMFTDREDYMEFAVSLALQFSSEQIVSGMIGLVKVLLEIPTDKPNNIEDLQVLLDSSILDYTRLNTKQLIGFRIAVIEYINTMLNNGEYSEYESKADKLAVDSLLESLVFVGLEFVAKWSEQQNLIKGLKNTKSITSLCGMVTDYNYMMIDHAIGQLNYPLFAKTTLRLLEHQNMDVRRKAIEVLMAKIEEFSGYLFGTYNIQTKPQKDGFVDKTLIPDTEGWSKSDIKSSMCLVELIPSLVRLMKAEKYNEAGDVSLESPVDITQLSILCVASLAQYFSVIYPEAFLQVFDVILGDKSKSIVPLIKCKTQAVQSSLLVLIARLISGLGTRAIQHMPKLMPNLITMFENGYDLLYKYSTKTTTNSTARISASTDDTKKKTLKKGKFGGKPNHKDRNVDGNDSTAEGNELEIKVADKGIELVSSSLVVLEVIVKRWANFLGPYLDKTFSVVFDSRICYLTTFPESLVLPGSEVDLGSGILVDGNLDSMLLSRKDITLRKKTVQKYNNILKLLASLVHPRVLLPAQFGFYQSKLFGNNNDTSPNMDIGILDIYTLSNLAKLLSLTVNNISNDLLIKFHKPLFKFFLTLFSSEFGNNFKQSYMKIDSSMNEYTKSNVITKKNGKGDVEFERNKAVSQVIDSILDNFVDFCVKLNESIFSPLFASFIDWAITAETGKDAGSGNDMQYLSSSFKLSLMYLAVNKLFGRLQSILTPYYKYIVDTSLDILGDFGVTSDYIGSDNNEFIKSINGDELRAPNKLWALSLESLRLSALHDSGDFWSAELFERFTKHLGGQVPNTLVYNEDGESVPVEDFDRESDISKGYLSRIETVLAPTISQLYLAVANDAMWKQLNHLVLLKSRSQSPFVRLGSLEIVKSSFDALGEEFLILVPETIPFLSELIDDEDSQVEALTNDTIVVIEKYLGESLQPYFN
ncbi:hypothetical protein BB558_003057 [Smittium angustum]|uniref:U3 small nucleolar RNA-associated protein 10 n=1 Tax=Smittium angustum TaxID=133377 RepID=A0A2U1J701_SMIAN|nr:hypothetical protein BB558_003057 [Smittium angustum]